MFIQHALIAVSDTHNTSCHYILETWQLRG